MSDRKKRNISVPLCIKVTQLFNHLELTHVSVVICLEVAKAQDQAQIQVPESRVQSQGKAPETKHKSKYLILCLSAGQGQARVIH